MQPKAIIPSRLHVAHSRPRAPSGAVWAPFIYVPPTSNSSETNSASKKKVQIKTANLMDSPSCNLLNVRAAYVLHMYMPAARMRDSKFSYHKEFMVLQMLFSVNIKKVAR